MTSDSYTFTADPAWPWSLSGVGLPALLAVALLLTALTVWTYRGQAKAGGRRVALMIALRLAALVLAVLSLVRPSLASRDNQKLPSALIILLDGSESMTITDESNNYSRWEALRRTMSRCEPVLKQLHDEQNITVQIFRFAEGLGPYDPQANADGKRTDFGEALHGLFHDKGLGSERQLRGLVIVSDGADNGTHYPPMAEAEKWRSISCPIHTFAVGQTTTTSKQKDIILLNIFPEPAPVPVKGKLTVRGLIDAPGFQGTTARLRLLVDDKEVAVQDEVLAKVTGNEVKLSTQAPDKPGEIKVTLKVDPQLGEVTHANNEVTTYVTVAKEGLSVLYVDKIRAFEPKFIRRALEDPRFRVDYLVRLADDPLTKSEAEFFDFTKQSYDVIILGDVTPRRLTGGNDAILNAIRDQVRRGTGLVMIGGRENFGKSWRGTPVADIMPVDMADDKEDDRLVRMVPTPEGLGLYLMKLADKPQENMELWNELPKLQATGLGQRKPNSIVLARADDAKDGPPLLVSGPLGTPQGRTLAFGGDSTWLWTNLGLPKSSKGDALHRRFWKQLILWLAKQEEAAGSVWIKPDTRRLGSGGKLGFNVGARGKNGEDLADVRFEVTVTNPQGAETTVPVAREPEGNRGTFWKTDAPGEYHMTVRAFTKEDGKERKMDDEGRVRFLVYQDTAEMARQAADHKFLADLAAAGGGKAHRLDELPAFLRNLQSQPLPQSRRPKTELWPDWRRTQTSAFLPSLLLAFVALLCVEWFLRRYWGLV